jgi:DNA/RNA-binding protein KIN17
MKMDSKIIHKVNLFASNPTKYLDEYSKEFESTFLSLLKRRYFTRSIEANKVYNEMIQDKLHVHMNSTIWATLHEFVTYLGKTGKCDIHQDEQGIWFVAFIDRDPEAVRKQLEKDASKKVELEEEEKHYLELQAKAAAAAAAAATAAATATATATAPATSAHTPASSSLPQPTHVKINLLNANALKRKRIDLPVDEGVAAPAPTATVNPPPQSPLLPTIVTPKTVAPPSQGPRTFNYPSLNSFQENWLLENIQVKIITHTLGDGKFFKAKGKVTSLVNEYVAFVQVTNLDSTTVTIKIDQDDLQTVLPSIHSECILVNGKYRGEKAILLELNDDKSKAKVKLVNDESILLEQVELDHITKLAS